MTIYIFRPNYAALHSKHGALKHKQTNEQTDKQKKEKKKKKVMFFPPNASALNEAQTLIILSPSTTLLNTTSSIISDSEENNSCSEEELLHVTFMSEGLICHKTDFCFSSQEVSGGRKIALHLLNYIALTCLNRTPSFMMDGETGSVLNT